MEHAASGCVLQTETYYGYYASTTRRRIYFNIHAGPDASDAPSSSQNVYQICKLASPSPPPPPALPKEYVPIGYVGRWRYETPALYRPSGGGYKDFLAEEYVEATGQFRGSHNYRYESGSYSLSQDYRYVGAYLQTTCAMDANGNMVTTTLYWRSRVENAYARISCRYRTREPVTRRTVASVYFTSDAVYAVADLQARYAPGSCPDLAVAMADGIAWMPDVLPRVNTTLYDLNCIEDCLDFTCALAAPPPSPPPSAPAHIASTDATASIYGLAIGIPVGVCLLGVAICSAVFWRRKRRRQTSAAGASADRAAPAQLEITAQPRAVTHQHSDFLTNTARSASTDGQHATPQQIAITVSQPEPLTQMAQVASPYLRDGDAGATKEARGKGGATEAAQPNRLAALLAACGLEHCATNFEDEGYTFEDLMGAMEQGGEAAVKNDLQDLKLTLGERRRIITELQRMDKRKRGQANASTPESGARVSAQPEGPPDRRWL
jgi:hypothetical protein